MERITRTRAAGAGSTTADRPSSTRGSVGRPASRQSARLTRGASSGVATPIPMVDESDLIEAVTMDVSPRKSQAVSVEIKVKKELRVPRTKRG